MNVKCSTLAMAVGSIVLCHAETNTQGDEKVNKSKFNKKISEAKLSGTTQLSKDKGPG